MSLSIYRAEYPDALVVRLAEMLAEAPSNPFEPELVAVPTNGIQRWLSEQIALTFAERGAGDGIAANIEWPYPSELVHRVLRRVPDIEPSIEAWHGRELEWHVQSVLTQHRSEPWLRFLDRFIRENALEQNGINGAQRLRAASKIRRLFVAYDLRRPEMVRSWAAGNNLGPSGEPIINEAAWQPQLWRLVRESLALASPAELLTNSLARIRSGDAALDLPDRLAVYGLTALNPTYLDVLQAVGEVRDVNLFLLYPSSALWETVAADYANRFLPTRNEDESRDLAVHPILRSWGQDVRELQLSLLSRSLRVEEIPEPTESSASNLLEALQYGIRHNELVTLESENLLRVREHARSDRSVQVHLCYGPQRQVEVLRDAILHLFTEDPTLQPRDVVIMTPELTRFAPLIEASFSNRSRDQKFPDLRVSIADRSPVQRNPLIHFARTILDLASSRLPARSVVELMALPVVQRRFDLDPDMLEPIEELIEEANVRWGIDADDRERAGTARGSEHTWESGIGRIVSGIFYSDSPTEIVVGLAPIHGIEGDRANAAVTLAYVIGHVEFVVNLLRTKRPSSQWTSAIFRAVGLLAASGNGEEWQWSDLQQLLEKTFSSEGSTIDPILGLDEAMVMTTAWMADLPDRLHHQTGDITVCSFAPMRSVPYRVVCLLGLDGPNFPRSSRTDGDDLLIDHEMVGDHDRGAEDRQLLLDALMAAGDYFVITYAGRDELTNVSYPPAVPVAELLDTVADIIGEEDAKCVVVEHPLQSFSSRNFEPGALGVAGPWGFDSMYFEGAIALRDRTDTEDVASWPLAICDESVQELALELGDLIEYFEHPSRYFARRSLHLIIPSPSRRSDDELPVELGGLVQWEIGQRLLEGVVRGFNMDDLVAHEKGRDSLPAGALAQAPLAETVGRVSQIIELAVESGFEPREFRQHMGTVTGRFGTLSGSVSADFDSAMVSTVTSARLKGKHRLAMYIKLLFLTALHPERSWRGLLVGVSKGRNRPEAVTIGPLPGDGESRLLEARERLSDLVSIRSEGVLRALPIFAETSYTWATTRLARREIDTGFAWVPSPFRFGTEGDDPYHRMIFPALVEVDDLLEGEFPVYAARIWGPIVPLLGIPQ